jgi:hypothetical protein
VDSRGRLYVTLLVEGPYVYLAPLRHWAQENLILRPDPAQRFVYYFAGTIAIEEPDTLYIEFVPRPNSLFATEYAVRTFYPANAGNPRDHLLLTRPIDCAHGGIADAIISGNYLLPSCNGRIPSVLVFKSHRYGKAPVIEKVGLGLLVSPTGIALGP